MQNLFKKNTTSVIEVKEKTYVNVPYSEKEKAKKCGAKWDKNKSKWYVESDVEAFYDKFTETTKLQRDLWKIQRQIDHCYKMIAHNNNADVTIYRPELDDQNRTRIKQLEKEKDKLTAEPKPTDDNYKYFARNALIE